MKSAGQKNNFFFPKKKSCCDVKDDYDAKQFARKKEQTHTNTSSPLNVAECLNE